MISASGKLSPATATFSRTWPAPGVGRGIVPTRRLSALPGASLSNAVITAASTPPVTSCRQSASNDGMLGMRLQPDEPRSYPPPCRGKSTSNPYYRRDALIVNTTFCFPDQARVRAYVYLLLFLLPLWVGPPTNSM